MSAHPYLFFNSFHHIPVLKNTGVKKLDCHSGQTNKKEYDNFCRQIKTSGKFPVALSEYAQTNRLELFNIWLDTNGDWNQCQLEVERKHLTKNETSRGWKAIQGKELRGKYTAEKFDALVKARTDAGLYYEDTDFPNDIDDSKPILIPNLLLLFSFYYLSPSSVETRH